MAPLWGTAVVLGSFGLAWLLNASQPEVYDRLSQEDGWIEWSTVWAFLVACGLWLRSARREGRHAWALAFPLAVAAFCFLVAMEEMSWGQRLLGAQAPDYFLEHNSQLEANLHNLASKDLRHLALSAVILGFGVGLPVVRRIPALGPLLDRLGVVAPAFALFPAFLSCFVLYLLYPWRLTGEWVELGLGGAVLFFGLQQFPGGRRGVGVATLATLGVAGAGWATTAVTRSVEAAPEMVAQARIELEALNQDHRAGLLRASCGTHKRIYSFLSDGADSSEVFGQGAFGALVQQGLPTERARFYLDPWHTPYWLLDECAEDGSRRIAFYSFGPNRARDGDHWALGGDDVGITVFEWRAPREE